MPSISGTIEKIFDARAMKVDGVRIGAPYKKDLADVTTGGALVEGAQVDVEYETRGKWNNASKIAVVAAPAPSAGGSPRKPSGGGGGQFRDPEEIIRSTAVEVAKDLIAGHPDIDFVNDLGVAAYTFIRLSEMVEMFIAGQISSSQLKAATGSAQAAKPEPEPEPEPEPTKEQTAAAAAASSAGSAMDDFIAGL